MGDAPELQYHANLDALGDYAGRFVAFRADEGTRAWIADVGTRPHSSVETWMVATLSRFVSSYDAHGLTATYAMHLLSEAQWGELAGARRTRLLDVGAGAGYVTENARPWFEHITCTETSRPLARRLSARGFKVHAHDILDQPLPDPHAFDLISCLNVIDRTRRPLSLLSALRALLGDDTRLVVSVPLPVRPHVHVAGATVSPQERLPMGESAFEAAAVEMSVFFESLGFAVERLSRLPYLSRGDARAPYYVLDDALWVLRASTPNHV